MDRRSGWGTSRPPTLAGRFSAWLVVIAVILAVALGTMLASLSRLETARKANHRTDQRVEAGAHVLRDVLDTQIGVRGFLLTGQERFLEPTRAAAERFPGDRARLLDLVDEHQAELVRGLAEEAADLVQGLGPQVVSDPPRTRRGIVAVLSAGNERVDALRTQVERFATVEQREGDQLEDAAIARAEQTRWVAITGTIAALLALALLGWRVQRLAVHPLSRLVEGTRRLAGGDYSARLDVPELRELAQVSASFNELGDALLDRDLMIAQQTEQLEERVAERTMELDRSRMEVLQRLALAAERRDDDTYAHTERVGALSERIAHALGLDQRRCELLRLAAPLHDVGKIGVPDAVLLKEGPFTPEERLAMQEHTTIGAEILGGSSSPVIQTAERIALTHHEWWDGSGYPAGLRGEEIPLEGRIVAIADVYDALTHDRPYRTALAPQEALDIVRGGSGTQFDAALVATFVRTRAIIEGLEGDGVQADRRRLSFDPDAGSDRLGALARAGMLCAPVLRTLPGTAVLVFDTALRFVMAEGRAFAARGIDPATIVGRSLGDVVPADRLAALRPIYDRTLAGFEVRTTISTADGVPYVVSSAPLRDEEGCIIGGLIVSHEAADGATAA